MGVLIRVTRAALEDGWANGYLVGKGAEFFCMHLVDDGIRLNGFTCMRYEDVSDVDVPAPHSNFVTTVLRLRHQTPVSELPVDFSTVRALLRSAGAAFPLVSLHPELKEPDICYVGRVLEVDGTSVKVRPISPGGTWYADDENHLLAEITRIDFGGAYEEALALYAKTKANKSE